MSLWRKHEKMILSSYFTDVIDQFQGFIQNNASKSREIVTHKFQTAKMFFNRVVILFIFYKS